MEVSLFCLQMRVRVARAPPYLTLDLAVTATRWSRTARTNLTLYWAEVCTLLILHARIGVPSQRVDPGSAGHAHHGQGRRHHLGTRCCGWPCLDHDELG